MSWNDKYIVPYYVLQDYLTINDLVNLSQLNHMFKKMRQNREKQIKKKYIFS